ncbi:glycosyltransferase family 2 protein [Acetobacter sp. LMG 32666]|uniref:glycosyltransferase family 2 protein n=1 Tax=Acetobacter sp. LMG 32666 TaxID=2959295 RepID=UPI0030C83690
MLKNKPAISVILTTYNCESRIEFSINSIINQTFQDIELIIVDDHSKDTTLNICHSIKNSNPSKNISIYQNKNNSGAAFSRNVGIHHAQGDYIIFLDDDDYYSPLMLELAYKKAIQNSADIVVVGSQSYDKQTNETYILDNIKIDLTLINCVFSYKDIKENFFESFTWWAWDKLIRRQLITDNNLLFQTIRSSNDLSFTCKSFFSARRICIERQIMVTHIVNRPTSLSSSRTLSYACILEALNDIKIYMEEKGIYPQLQADFFYYCVNFIYWHQSTINKEESILLCQKTISFFKDLNIKIDSTNDDNTKSKYLHIFISAGYPKICELIEETKAEVENNSSPSSQNLKSFLHMLIAIRQFIHNNTQ